MDLFDNKQNESGSHDEFKPPRLPYLQLATTFILPLLVGTLPQLANKSLSTEKLVILALIVFGILMFVMWFMAYMRLYNEAYRTQILRFEQAELSKKTKEYGEKLATQEQQLQDVKIRLYDVANDNQKAEMLQSLIKEFKSDNPEA